MREIVLQPGTSIEIDGVRVRAADGGPNGEALDEKLRAILERMDSILADAMKKHARDSMFRRDPGL